MPFFLYNLHFFKLCLTDFCKGKESEFFHTILQKIHGKQSGNL